MDKKEGKTTRTTVAEAKPKEKKQQIARADDAPTTKNEGRFADKKIDPTPTSSLPPREETKSVDEASNPEFRWPVRGRVISAFKSGENDGVNISVPEGTPVKAAEAGVVAYAGNELKGYGNLVLVRHPSGYVSAYAHNSEIEVRKGDQVKRGQVLAKAGQTGNVSSPQVHFELRKGSSPVDPSNYLAGM
jgi:murein DD-endopeptidase MepM/ murein hydrolase activator NlpD